jgi:hypothetical protein
VSPDQKRQFIPEEALVRVTDSTQALDGEPATPVYSTFSRALEDLTNALQLLPETHPMTISELRKQIGQLKGERAGETAESALKEGLTLALRVLSTRTPPSDHASEYRASVHVLSDSISELDVGMPPDSWYSVSARALRAATDATHLAFDVEPPFGEAGNQAPLTASDLGEVDDKLVEARKDILKLGQVRWPHAREASADALESLAELIEASDEKSQQAERVSIIRLNAERLASAGVHSFGESKWVKAGLSTALDALDNLAPDNKRVLSPWNAAARRAVDGIGERDALSFQRAALQDGFRATLDAFALAMDRDLL